MADTYKTCYILVHVQFFPPQTELYTTVSLTLHSSSERLSIVVLLLSTSHTRRKMVRIGRGGHKQSGQSQGKKSQMHLLSLFLVVSVSCFSCWVDRSCSFRIQNLSVILQAVDEHILHTSLILTANTHCYIFKEKVIIFATLTAELLPNERSAFTANGVVLHFTGLLNYCHISRTDNRHYQNALPASILKQ